MMTTALTRSGSPAYRVIYFAPEPNVGDGGTTGDDPTGDDGVPRGTVPQGTPVPPPEGTADQPDGKTH